MNIVCLVWWFKFVCRIYSYMCLYRALMVQSSRGRVENGVANVVGCHAIQPWGCKIPPPALSLLRRRAGAEALHAGERGVEGQAAHDGYGEVVVNVERFPQLHQRRHEGGNDDGVPRWRGRRRVKPVLAYSTTQHTTAHSRTQRTQHTAHSVLSLSPLLFSFGRTRTSAPARRWQGRRPCRRGTSRSTLRSSSCPGAPA